MMLICSNNVAHLGRKIITSLNTVLQPAHLVYPVSGLYTSGSRA